MTERAPPFPDNPDHANGTCEQCGGPCAVYGCRWCPDCYGLPEVMAQRLGRGMSIAQHEAIRAFQRLSPRGKFEHWLRLQGKSWPTEDLRECPSLVDVVAAGQDWVTCAGRMPHEDRDGRLRYMVYSPAYGGWLWCCRHLQGQWACADGLLIGGVSHWRLARDDEQERQAAADELPAAAQGEPKTLRPR